MLGIRIRILCDFLSWENDVNVPSKSNKQKNLLKNSFLLASWRSRTKIAGSGSIIQRYGSVDPDPYKIVMDPQHWSEMRIRIRAKMAWIPNTAYSHIFWPSNRSLKPPYGARWGRELIPLGSQKCPIFWSTKICRLSTNDMPGEEKIVFTEIIYLCATSEKLIFFTDLPFLLYNKMIFPLVQFVFLLCCWQGRQWTQCVGNNSPVSLSFSFLLRFMYNGFDVTFKSQKLCM